MSQLSSKHQLAPMAHRSTTSLSRPSRVLARHADTQATLEAIAFTESSLSQAGEDEVWMISYMDIMTLLLTLFVLLFAYTKVTSESSPDSQHARITTITTYSPHQPTLPAAQPLIFSVRQQTSLPKAELAGISADTLPREAMQHLAIPPSWAWPEAPIRPMQVEDPPADPQKEHHPSTLTEANPAGQPPAASAAASTRKSFLETIHASALGTRIEVTTHQDSINLEISDSILFEPGSATLKPLGQQLLDELAALLANQNYSVSVEGHTDNVPIENLRFASNWELSTTRATNVTRYLIVRGITASRLRAVGYADTHPRTDNTTAQGRARNRRVSLVLHLPLGQEVADDSEPSTN